jgi:hypothetical protein
MPGYSRPLDLAQQLVALNGSPQYLGTIAANATVNNSDTAAPFDIPAGAVIQIQADAGCCFRAGTSDTITVTTGNGVELVADERHTFILASDEAYLAVIGTGGAANVKVWQLR